MKNLNSERNRSLFGLPRVQVIRKATQAGMLLLMVMGGIHYSMEFFFLVLAGSILIGPFYCGWLCPFGFFQEIIGGIGAVLRKKMGIRVPPIPGGAKYFRLVFGFLMVVLLTAGLVPSMDETVKTAAMAGFFTLVMLLNLLWPRFFCRLFCPMGAVLGLLNLVKIYPLRVQPGCRSCGACGRICPMGVQALTRGNSRDIACIACMQCRSACPIEGGLAWQKKKQPEELLQNC